MQTVCYPKILQQQIKEDKVHEVCSQIQHRLFSVHHIFDVITS